MPERTPMNPALAPDPLRFFTALGEKTLAEWRKNQFDELAFTDAAQSALDDLPPHANVCFRDVAIAGLTEDQLPFQEDIDASFGQPPLTVYWHPDFRVELLFWVRSLPGIHQHAFSGAFHVLHGSSLHTVWDFECHNRITTRLLIGSARQRAAELLRTGATRRILAGKGLIHATYHLDCPSVTVVIRTNRESDHLPQYLYLPPTIAYDVLRPGPLIKRRLQLLRMLVSAGKHDDLGEILRRVLATADVFTAFHILNEMYIPVNDAAERNNLLLHVKQRFPALAGAAEPALKEQLFRQRIVSLRDRVNNPDLQFFLALLLNVSERDAIHKLIRDRYQQVDTHRRIVGWVREMSSLGLLDCPFPDAWFRILERLLHSTPPAEVWRAFGPQFTDPASRESTTEIASAINEHWLFRKLLHDGRDASRGASEAGLSQAQTAIVGN